MSAPSAANQDGFPRVFPLRGGRGAVVLHDSGLRHPRNPRFLGETFTSYRDVTHHSVTSRGLRLGTLHSAYSLPRALFEDPHAADEIARELVDRIGGLPGGREQLDRMWEVEKFAARQRPIRLVAGVALLCAVVFAAESLFEGQRLFLSGLFSDSLVRGGEVWRLVTANFLHGGIGHLLLNVLGLLAIGSLVERALGGARTALVVGAGALGGMGAGLLVGYEMAVGASGIVFGLVGALLWLELREARRLPSSWRVPRAILLGAVLGDGLLSVLVPAVAGAAHLGGLVAGAVATAVVAPGALEGRRVGVPVLVCNALLLLGLGASLAAAGALAFRDGSPVAGPARVLTQRPDVPVETLNNFAWLIATDPKASDEDREMAVELAERAVEGTERGDPNVLDTLAEAQFAAGRAEAAVETIDEAILLAPAESYFREQRRRFTGERSADDRPDPPAVGPTPQPRQAPEPPSREPEDEGLRV